MSNLKNWALFGRIWHSCFFVVKPAMRNAFCHLFSQTKQPPPSTVRNADYTFKGVVQGKKLELVQNVPKPSSGVFSWCHKSFFQCFRRNFCGSLFGSWVVFENGHIGLTITTTRTWLHKAVLGLKMISESKVLSLFQPGNLERIQGRLSARAQVTVPSTQHHQSWEISLPARNSGVGNSPSPDRAYWCTG